MTISEQRPHDTQRDKLAMKFWESVGLNAIEANKLKSFSVERVLSFLETRNIGPVKLQMDPAEFRDADKYIYNAGELGRSLLQHQSEIRSELIQHAREIIAEKIAAAHKTAVQAAVNERSQQTLIASRKKKWEEFEASLKANPPPSSIPAAAPYVHYLRGHRSQADIEAAIHALNPEIEKISAYNIRMWEWNATKGIGNIFAIPPDKLGLVTFALSSLEFERLAIIKLTNPALIAKSPDGWVEDKVRTKDWNAISFPAFDTEWLDHQPKKQQAGLLLRDYIESAMQIKSSINNRSLRKFFYETADIQSGTASDWEMGKKLADEHKTGHILSAATTVEEQLSQSGLANGEHSFHKNRFSEFLKKYAKIAHPSIIEIEGKKSIELEKWLTKQIENKNWDAISYPALSKEWLDYQPENIRGGQVLYDLLAKKGITYEGLAKSLHYESRDPIRSWATDKKPIRQSHIGNVANALECNEQEAYYFITEARPDIIKSNTEAPSNILQNWLKTQIQNKNWEAINLPALDPTWLDLQDPKKQSGLYLADLIYRSQKSLVTVADDIKVERPVISNWITFRSPIHVDKIPALSKSLNLGDDEVQRLEELIQRRKESPMRSVNTNSKQSQLSKN